MKSAAYRKGSRTGNATGVGVRKHARYTVSEIYGADVSQGPISKITDKIRPEVHAWQNRPLEKIYLVVNVTIYL